MRSHLVSLSLLLAIRSVLSTKLGAITYFDPTSKNFNWLPSRSMVVINPDSGIFVDDGGRTLVSNVVDFQTIVETVQAKSITALGYVRTGYFDHTCDSPACPAGATLSQSEHKSTPTSLPSPPSTASFSTKPLLIIGIVRLSYPNTPPSNPSSTATNPTSPSPSTLLSQEAAAQLVDAAKKGEIVVLYEDSHANLKPNLTGIRSTATCAKTRGVQSWVLIYGATKGQVKSSWSQLKAVGVNWLYATNIGGNWQAGENTWGSLLSAGIRKQLVALAAV